MALTQETEKAALEAFLLEQKAVNIYAIGDLHPSCWADCVWDGLREPRGGALRAVALTYRGLAVPVLQVLADPSSIAALDAAKRALQLLVAAAPERLPAGAFEAHLNSGFETVLRDAGFAVEAHPHLRMVLAPDDLVQLRADPQLRVDRPLRGQGRAATPRRLTPADADACMDLCGTLERSWFQPQCLDSGIYYGVYSDDDSGGSLLAMGGTHVAAPEYGVAALGNIATRASQRRKGYGRLVVRALCLALADHGIETIGLNVAADNQAAIAMYKGLHFNTAMEFVECDVEKQRGRAAAQAVI